MLSFQTWRAIAFRKMILMGRSDLSPGGARSARPPGIIILKFRVSSSAVTTAREMVGRAGVSGSATRGDIPDFGKVARRMDRFKPVGRVHIGHYRKSLLPTHGPLAERNDFNDNDAICKPVRRATACRPCEGIPDFGKAGRFPCHRIRHSPNRPAGVRVEGSRSREAC